MAGLFVFDPSYVRTDVIFYQPDFSNPGQFISTEIPGDWCATEAGAAAMITWLKALGLTTTETEMPSFPNFADGVFTDAANIAANPQNPTPVKVPFLQDGKGATENVGYLMWMFKQLPVELAIRTDLTEFSLDDTQ